MMIAYIIGAAEIEEVSCIEGGIFVKLIRVEYPNYHGFDAVYVGCQYLCIIWRYFGGDNMK